MPEWDTPETPYKNIYETLRELIETEVLKPGDKLPSNRALMEEYGAASHTVQRAIRALKDSRLVETVPNSGTTVRGRPQTVERSAAYTAAPTPGTPVPYKAKSRIIYLGPVSAPSYVAERMDIEPGETVLLRRRVMERDGMPVEIVSSYYPMAVAEGTELAEAAPLRGGSPAALERLGVPSERTAEWVYTRLPLKSEVEILRLAPNNPVLRLLRSVLASAGRPVEVIEMIMDGERNVLRYDM